MPLNGKIGRAKTLKRIRKEREAEAIKAGIDLTDRAALRAWDNERSRKFWKALACKFK